MRIGLDNEKEDISQAAPTQSDDLAELIKERSEKKETPFSELDGKKKAEYIWDYYKWWILGAIAAIVALTVFIRDYRENSKPVYLYAEMLNTYFGYDRTNTVYDDFVREAGIDLTKEQLTIGVETTLSEDNYDTTMLAFQQRLVANYAAAELDVIIGPKNIIEGPANWDCYADFNEILPADLIEDLKERDYGFYYYDPATAESDEHDSDTRDPYFAGIYLDNCSYLNNMGENGAYPAAETEEDRPVFTIAANSQRTDHAVEFLRFLVNDR